jgi:hypothetical protein
VADLGQWFKLWCSALDDPDLDSLPLDQFARWAKLGALVKRQGTAGQLRLKSPGRVYLGMFQVPDFDALLDAFHALPGVCVRREKRNIGNETSAIVSFRNWSKYQADLSTPRVRKFREMKRLRGEEKRLRGEERRGDSPPTLIRGGSDQPERRVRSAPKPVSRRSRIRYGRGSMPIRAPIRPIVDAWVAGFTARFRVAPGDPKPWDLDAAEDLLARHGLPLVLEILDGALRVGTQRMRTQERWSLQAISDEWETLVAMRAKGELA